MSAFALVAVSAAEVLMTVIIETLPRPRYADTFGKSAVQIIQNIRLSGFPNTHQRESSTVLLAFGGLG